MYVNLLMNNDDKTKFSLGIHDLYEEIFYFSKILYFVQCHFQNFFHLIADDHFLKCMKYQKYRLAPKTLFYLILLLVYIFSSNVK